MEGMPRLAFAAAVTVALSLALLLTVLLLLLANLFCSLLRRRGTSRGCREPAAASPEEPSIDRPLSFPFYAHGVLQAPTKFLLSVPSLEEAMATATAKTARGASPPPPRKAAEDFVCISNPIYDGVSRECGGGGDGSTPFVTPEASPSGLEADDGEVVAATEEGGDDWSPPLKLMKKLPPAPPPRATLAACLVVDGGRRSLATSTETNRPSSSSSSNSLCSSPSW